MRRAHVLYWPPARPVPSVQPPAVVQKLSRKTTAGVPALGVALAAALEEVAADTAELSWRVLFMFTTTVGEPPRRLIRATITPPRTPSPPRIQAPTMPTGRFRRRGRLGLRPTRPASDIGSSRGCRAHVLPGEYAARVTHWSRSGTSGVPLPAPAPQLLALSGVPRRSGRRIVGCGGRAASPAARELVPDSPMPLTETAALPARTLPLLPLV